MTWMDNAPNYGRHKRSSAWQRLNNGIDVSNWLDGYKFIASLGQRQ